MNHGLYGSPPAYSGILNPLHTVSKFCFDLSNPLTIQFQYLELFSSFLLMVWYPVGGKKRVTLNGALNHFKLVMWLSISFDNCILGFSDAETIDSLLDDIVVDLSLGSGGEDCIKIISSSFSLFYFWETIGLTREREMNWLVCANDSCSSQIWLSITKCPWPWHVVNLFTRLYWILWNYWGKASCKMSLSVSVTS